MELRDGDRSFPPLRTLTAPGSPVHQMLLRYIELVGSRNWEIGGSRTKLAASRACCRRFDVSTGSSKPPDIGALKYRAGARRVRGRLRGEPRLKQHAVAQRHRVQHTGRCGEINHPA